VKISVIIPAYNEEKLLPEALRGVWQALPAFTARGWETEVVVCDNNSTDQTAQLAQAAGARVVFEPFNQIARARNTGARAATGEWLVFMDADSTPTAALFAEVAEVIGNGGFLAGGVTLRLQGPYRVATRIARVWNGISRACKLMAGSFVFVESQAFWAVGGFNQELFVSEEIDLSQRLKRLGRQQKRKLVILHRHPLLTSARKIHLYTPREHLRFWLRTLFTFKRNLRRREECQTWYDGRR